MDDLISQIGEILAKILTNLTNPEAWKETLARPGIMVAAIVTLWLIIFTETGLLVGFFLPGDSLLVVAGIVAQIAGWNVWMLIVLLSIAAIIGDTVGYWIGAKTGPAIFRRPDSRFFKQAYLLQAKAFYERHGGKTIVFARFVPIVRTFVPVVAGAAKMDYRTFVFYNVFGGIGWVMSMVLGGFYLIPVLDPPTQRLLNNPGFTWAKQIDKIAILVILISVMPIVIKAF